MKEKKTTTSIGMSTMENGAVNLAYDGEEFRPKVSIIDANLTENNEKALEVAENEQVPEERMQWGSEVEFLMSCIAMSVGLGNIWRFPFTAYENGGGAFLIPYIIVLVVVGRPLYYLEMAIGQFASKGSVHVWELAPLMKGIGYGQIFANICILTYYCALMAITLFYFVASFSSELPWSRCKPDWPDCFDSVASKGNFTPQFFNRQFLRSSSELYFKIEVLHEKSQINDGIGLPDWKLTLCLAVSWLMIFLTLIKGIQSSGKASYFLALFPYVVLTALLIRGCTLPGALNGIIFFIKPQWDQLLNPKVWYAAVTQAFFSLTVCFGALITYSSYNGFRHNIHRDAMIVTVMDTATSLIAGITIFAILGNLAHESGTTDLAAVTQGGTGLAFISYPDAIAKFDFVPQLFSVLFFVMLYTLGIGSAVSCHGAVVTMITDNFPSIKYWKVALGTSIAGFLSGLIYVTPGGQYMLTLVDYYAGSFAIFVLASFEAIAINWIYGLDNFCNDVEFMLNMKIGIYWRLCWGLFTPVSLVVILIYTVATYSPLDYNGHLFPSSAYACGWLLVVIAFAQIPIWAIVAICKDRREPVWETAKSLLKPSSKWGPANPLTRKEWEQMKRKKTEELEELNETPMRKFARVLCSCNRGSLDQ